MQSKRKIMRDLKKEKRDTYYNAIWYAKNCMVEATSIQEIIERYKKLNSFDKKIFSFVMRQCYFEVEKDFSISRRYYGNTNTQCLLEELDTVRLKNKKLDFNFYHVSGVYRIIVSDNNLKLKKVNRKLTWEQFIYD